MSNWFKVLVLALAVCLVPPWCPAQDDQVDSQSWGVGGVEKVWCTKHLKYCPKNHGEPIMATVVGRYIFYPNCVGFGNAIDTSKTPLLPGGTGAFANYVTWVRQDQVPQLGSIGGIYIDIDGLANPGGITAADFAFRYGNDNFPDNWDDANAPDSVSVDEGAGDAGSDRITIQWGTSAVPNANWLQVTVLANDNTGLDDPDVFYWGLALGDTGNSETDAIVNAEVGATPPSDWDLVLANVHPFIQVPITNPYDLNKDSKVLHGDLGAVSLGETTAETALQLITPVVLVIEDWMLTVGTRNDYAAVEGSRNDYGIVGGSLDTYMIIEGAE